MRDKLKGLYVITDKRLIQRSVFLQIVEMSLEGGADIIQLREKDTPAGELIELALMLKELTDRWQKPLIINDRPEIAKQIGAAGVHLGETDISLSEARRILGGDAIIGVSCYGGIERGLQAEAAGADYLAFGTPYSTPTKPGRTPTPFETLVEAKLKIKTVPIFAIGGITAENANDVLDTGVDGIAVITSVFGSSDPKRATKELADAVKSHR